MSDPRVSILDTIENFIDTCPEMEGKDVETSMDYMGPECVTMRVTVDGVDYKVVVSEVGRPVR